MATHGRNLRPDAAFFEPCIPLSDALFHFYVLSRQLIQPEVPLIGSTDGCRMNHLPVRAGSYPASQAAERDSQLLSS